MAEGFEVGVQDDLIIVREPTTGLYAIYSKPAEQPQLILQRRKPANHHTLLLEPRRQRTRRQFASSVGSGEDRGFGGWAVERAVIRVLTPRRLGLGCPPRSAKSVEPRLAPGARRDARQDFPRNPRPWDQLCEGRVGPGCLAQTGVVAVRQPVRVNWQRTGNEGHHNTGRC